MKSSKYISILCVGSLLSLASCTDGFESDNKINGSFDDTVKKNMISKNTLLTLRQFKKVFILTTTGRRHHLALADIPKLES